jgi:hypothetical protein
MSGPGSICRRPRLSHVKLDQRDNWRPNGPLRYRLIVPILVVIGWTLTTLVVAGFTSIVRRD